MTASRRAAAARIGPLAGCLLVLGCGQEPGSGSGPGAGSPPPRAPAALSFIDVAEEVGLSHFRQYNGTADKRFIVDSTGAGVALFDYDGDGDLDVFLVNGRRPEEGPAAEPATNALFRNERHGRSFHDVTAEAGLLSRGAFGQGVAVADVDGDGLPDLYVTNHGPNLLYLNNGDGTFRDRTAAAGVGDPGWSTGASFGDFDRDGDLDLYVANYIDWEAHLAAHPGGTFRPWKGYTVMAGPKGLPGAPDRFYRNRGDGTFEDASAAVGLDPREDGYGFQVSIGDYDNDGDQDIFVANDSNGNFLLRNRGDGTFTEVSIEAGVKHQESGIAQASMGVAFDDFDGDGFADIFVTTFSDDVKTLYRNQRDGYFAIANGAAGLTTESAFKSLGWGTFFFDADSDGRLDLFVANGHVFPVADNPGTGVTYAQKNFLYRNLDGQRFEDVSDRAGPGFQIAKVSRGAAFGDLDDDGDLDIVINNMEDTPTVLRNDTAGAGHWLKVELRGSGGNRTAIGGRAIVTSGGRTQVREVRSSDSFLSSSDPRLHFGLGDAVRVDRLEVWWPDGSREVAAEGLGVDRLVRIEQCTGGLEERPY